jgi:xylose isomerase
MRHAVIAGFMGPLRDRFCEYPGAPTTMGKLELLSRIPGVSGAEIVYPYETEEVRALQQTLLRLKLEVAAVNVNLKSDPDFHRGGLSSPDPQVREKAVAFIKGAKDFAATLGVSKVTCCPLADGYDYSFHTHYARAWERMVESLLEAAGYRPEVALYIEYKPSETRVHCLVDSAVKALMLCSELESKRVGVTLDFGHSIYGGETPAEALAHIARSGFLYYIHINDNNGRWDWDLITGTHHFWEYLEFLYYLKQLRYNDWFTSDTSPVRQDASETFALNVRLTNRIWNWLDTIDRELIARHLERHEFIPIMKYLEGFLFSNQLAAASEVLP